MYNIYSIVCTGWSKKAPYFVFHPKVVFYNFFSIFLRWCRQQANAGEILAGTMYLIEGQFNIWWPNLGRQQM